MTEIHLPAFVNGRPIESDTATFEYANDLVVHVGKLDAEHIEASLDAAKEAKALRTMPTADVVEYLFHCGRHWKGGKSRPRSIATDHVADVTGYPQLVIEKDFHLVADILTNRFDTWDQIAVEFGSRHIFDEWIPNEVNRIRAFPRGVATHVLVGNVPVAGFYSLFRSIVSRNTTLAKLPSRDPLSSWAVAASMVESDPDNPLSKSLTFGYWDRGSKAETTALENSDSVTVWGGADAVKGVRDQVPAGVPVVDYGPKWSMSAIDLTRTDPERAAYRLVDDVAFYEQEACFNVQHAYIKGLSSEFLDLLEREFERFDGHHPQQAANLDANARRSARAMSWRFAGHEVRSGTTWAFVIADEHDMEIEAPLSRSLVIHPCDDWSSLTNRLNRESQTLTVFPTELGVEHGDEWALAGADRIVDLGYARMPRLGFTHDAIHGLHPMVRLVCREESRAIPDKFSSRTSEIGSERQWFLGEAQ